MDSLESSLGSEKIGKLEYKGEFYGEIPQYIGIGSWGSTPSEEEEIREKPLSVLESTSVACLLQDAMDELTILKYVIAAPEVRWNLRYRTPTERYTRRMTPVRIFPEADGTPILTSAIKLQRDRESIESVFQKTTLTLIDSGDYGPLSLALACLRDEENDDILLVQELKSNLLYLKDLRSRVEEKRKMDEREEKERDELMYQLQDELDDVILKCDVEEKFVNKWESVRNAQNDWRLNQSETYFKDNITKLATKSKLEKRVTHELQMYLRLRQTELEEELEEWMARYDAEMERRENKIIHMKYDRDQAEEKKYQLQKMYESRNLEMEEWVEFRELRKIRTGASLVIQSWWRGMMVRKKLGPYKPKKNKEKGDKKKN